MHQRILQGEADRRHIWQVQDWLLYFHTQWCVHQWIGEELIPANSIRQNDFSVAEAMQIIFFLKLGPANTKLLSTNLLSPFLIFLPSLKFRELPVC